MQHTLVHLAIRFPKLAGVIGLVAAIIFGALGISSYFEMNAIGQAPERATLADIAARLAVRERYWVVVTDGALDCGTLHYDPVGSDVNTEIFLENPQGTIVMLVHQTGRHTCSELADSAITGVAYPMSERHRSLLTGAGRLDDYPAGTFLFELCTTCGRQNFLGLILLALVFVPLGLSLYPLALWCRTLEQRPAVADHADSLFEN